MKHLAIIICMFFIGSAYADLIPIDKNKTILSEKYDFKITSWFDKENSIYNVGEKLKIYIKSNKDCYITVLDLSTSGNIEKIFPNELDKDNFITAGEVLSIPKSKDYDLEVRLPKGVNTIKIIANTDSPLTPDYVVKDKGVTKDLMPVQKDKSITTSITRSFHITQSVSK